MRYFLMICQKRTVIAVLCLLVTVACSGCGALGKDFRYIDEPFYAEACGRMGDRDVSVSVFCDPTSYGEEVYKKLTVTFFAPEELKGMTVDLFSDGSGSLRLGNIEGGDCDFCGIAEPFLIFCPEGDISSVKKEKDGRVVTFGEGEGRVWYFFGGDGGLKRIEGAARGEKILLNVTNFYIIGK